MEQAQGIESSEAVFRQVIESTDSFLQEASRHHLEGLKELMAQRRRFIAMLDDKSPLKLSKLRRGRLLSEIKRQAAELDKVGQKIKREMEKAIVVLRNSAAVCKKMNSRLPQRSRFIDRKS